MNLPHTAAEYARLADDRQTDAYESLHKPEECFYYLGEAQVYATLAQAAATLEAAALMGPTPEDQARLDALVQPPTASEIQRTASRFYCTHEWTEAEAAIPTADPDAHTNGNPHRCAMAQPHPDDPHYCRCGSEK